MLIMIYQKYSENNPTYKSNFKVHYLAMNITKYVKDPYSEKY